MFTPTCEYMVSVNCRFWDEEVPFTPESRVAVHEHMKKLKEKEDQKKYAVQNIVFIIIITVGGT